MNINKDEQLSMLSSLFGSYKAEWLHDYLFELYSEPSYFPELATRRPCVLNGGRGTGKTTVLRSMSYIGQWEILKRRFPNFDNQQYKQEALGFPYYGLYYRVNTTRVSAFQGASLSTEEWQKLFLHYANITFSYQLIAFLEWYQTNVCPELKLSSATLEKVCDYLAIDRVDDFKALSKAISKALFSVESYINNIGIDPRPKLSTSGALDSVFTEITALNEFNGKMFFLIIDEYENFTDEQQQVINTLIKHTSEAFTFKIGVRKLGWRVRYTLNRNEQLHSPADFVLIDIAEKMNDDDFYSFAEKICEARLSKLFEQSANPPESVKLLFPSLTAEKEALQLGLGDAIADLRKSIHLSQDVIADKIASQLTDLDLYVVKYWAEGQNELFIDVLRSVPKDVSTWRYRFEEYSYASLFSLRKGKSGIKKYYSGWDVFTKLAAKNIRYFLELIEQSLILHLREDGELGAPISHSTQTTAAQNVGKKNLEELQGLSTYGAKLTKLVLGLGRIFGILAEESAGHANEVNQFRVRPVGGKSPEDSIEWLLQNEHPAADILRAAVMHLAVIAFPGNKPKDEGETKDNTYQLHPIFAPYFVFSHRKRRNLVLEEEQVIGLIDRPRDTIRAILATNNRIASSALPTQLTLFQFYYDGLDD